MVGNVAIFVSILVVSVMAIKFKDLNLINNCLLEDIKRQNLELKRSMETFQVVNKMNPIIPPLNVDTLDGNFRPLSSMFAEDTGFNRTEEELSDTESDSFNSTRTDRTFDPNSLDVGFSEDNFGRAATSRETTPTNQTTDVPDMAMEALTSSLVHSTPAKKKITNRKPTCN